MSPSCKYPDLGFLNRWTMELFSAAIKHVSQSVPLRPVTDVPSMESECTNKYKQ